MVRHRQEGTVCSYAHLPTIVFCQIPTSESQNPPPQSGHWNVNPALLMKSAGIRASAACGIAPSSADTGAAFTFQVPGLPDPARGLLSRQTRCTDELNSRASIEVGDRRNTRGPWNRSISECQSHRLLLVCRPKKKNRYKLPGIDRFPDPDTGGRTR